MAEFPARLAILVAAAALGLTACSGGSSAPSVASLGNSTGSSTAAASAAATGTPTATQGNATQLVDEWAACMRGHGDPGQADPVIDADKVIHIIMAPSVPGGVTGSNGQSGSGPGTYCVTYLNAASAALRDGQPAPAPPSQAQLVKYAECMRANGVPDFPDPTAGGFQLHSKPGSDLDTNNPAYQDAAKVCVKKTGVYPVGGGGPLPPGSYLVAPYPGASAAPLVPVSGGNGG